VSDPLPPTCDPLPPSSSGDAPTAVPACIGRYRVERVLGAGGFGVVYLAHDDDLRRPVAIKVPQAKRLAQAGAVDAYLAEARVLAALNHPHIVRVHDFGRTPDGGCFIVSEYLGGGSLADLIRQRRLTTGEAVALVVPVADALQHAHQHRLVHRDVKPANILLDAAGKPYLADFGLALRDEDFGSGSGRAGTPWYMSPEQARGEGHRVDGRADVYSLGAALYELLTGQVPFRRDRVQDLLEDIASLTVEARPPRQLVLDLPRELERICLKALAKRPSERYPTAHDFADDLRAIQAQQPPPLPVPPSVPDAAGPLATGAAAPLPTPVGSPATSDSGPALDATGEASAAERLARVVPKGLRAFDAGDRDFFLELVPGPRDRTGLPDSLRFWKGRIEATDPEQTFTVGLVYGPSGCGKSSLVKAGLLPRLARHVLPVYVEAADQTEARLLRGLARSCPRLDTGGGLVEALAALRRGAEPAVGSKVLLVLDQFEQFLHAHGQTDDSDLVRALRQCDGGRVQALLLVRDDFWLAVSRFLENLEVRLLQGDNCAAAHLFDLRHARKVLAAFGRAFGALPPAPAGLSRDQEAFLDQAVAGLARDGRVIPVRLVLFAEMVKARPWEPATLKAVGGTEGVGVAFLEESFAGPSANPRHRLHQKAARGVLKALLPESGTDIKGAMRPAAELEAASGYAGRPREFADLLHVLDGELRLVTPTDPEGAEQGEPGASATGVLPASATGARARYYQLTHDYLVPAVRDWLTRKQKETRRGRAQLRLAERAAAWNAKPESRQLPAWWEWLNIRLFTRKKDWTGPQRRMMRQAGRRHGVRGLALVAVLLFVGWAGYEVHGRLRAQSLVESLVTAETADVPRLLGQLDGYRRWADPRLVRHLHDSPEDAKEHLHASLALLAAGDEGQAEYLYGRLLAAGPAELMVIRGILLPGREALRERLWAVLEDGTGDADQRLRAAGALAKDTAEDPRWDRAGGDVATRLAAENAAILGPWLDALRPVGGSLLPAVATMIEDDKRSVSELGKLAGIYGNLAGDRPDAFAQLQTRLAEPGEPKGTLEARVAQARRRARLGAALVIMGRGEKVWTLLRHNPDPTVRSYLIEWLGPAGLEAKALLARLDPKQEPDASARMAVLLSLADYDRGLVRLAGGEALVARLLRLYEEDPDAGIHGAAGWLLRQWGEQRKVEEIERGLATATGKPQGQRRWYVNGQGQTFTIIADPAPFLMGSPEGEPGHDNDEGQQRRHIDHGFALATREVTVAEFRRFRKDHQHFEVYTPTPDCPVNNVTWYEAAAYCNWLSQRERLPREQWCYLPNDDCDYAQGMRVPADFLQRAGYRLPTEEEWECACRAGSATAWSMGDAEDLLPRYAWYTANAGYQSHPVGSLRPNDWGLFDLHGNAWEWCHDRSDKAAGGKRDKEDISDKYSRLLRGGSFSNDAVSARSAHRPNRAPANRLANLGFRLARTHHE
jgi:formylglycine-generating enzyme required for sulfatase activity